MGNVVFNSVGLIVDGQNHHSRDITFFIPHILFPFPNVVPTLPIMQLNLTLSDIITGTLSDDFQLPLEPQKGFTLLFWIYSMRKFSSTKPTNTL